MFSWNSKQYLKFKNQRTRPATDLAKSITFLDPNKIIDIGCGPGNSTEVLQKRFPKAQIIGIDSSPDMIQTAKSRYNNIEFVCCDVNELFGKKEKYDIVFSNACIQWIPDHKNLLKNLMSLLNKNGVLAVQVPFNFGEPIHKIISSTTSSEKWKSVFNRPREQFLLSDSEYYNLLSEISSEFQMWLTTYYHKMKTHDDIMEWYCGTGLRPYLEQLDEKKKSEFECEIFEKIRQAYPQQKSGDIIFRFPRLFFTAEK